MSDEAFWCPAGYVPLHRVRSTAFRWAKSGEVDPSYAVVFETSDHMAEDFGSSLAQGTLHAIGVSVASGKLLEIAPEDWRRMHANPPGSKSYSYPIQAALDGYPIWVGAQPYEELCHAALALDELQRCLPPIPDVPDETAERSSAQSRKTPPIVFKKARRRRGGTPPRYDWEALWIEVVRQTMQTGLHHAGRVGLQKHLEDWTAERWHPLPEPSTIRRRMMRLYGKLGHTPGAAPEEVSADPKHSADWDAFWIEVVRYVAKNGFKLRRDLHLHMMTWMEQAWMAKPRQADIAHRITRLYHTLHSKSKEC